MQKIGIFFGTDTGTTRLIAKKMAKCLGDLCDAPLNVNRIQADAMLRYNALILGTPSYGEGQLPGMSTGVKAGSWEEFLPQLKDADLSGKKVAVYGLGNQDKYADRFADSLILLHDTFKSLGAELVGAWPVDSYQFSYSKSVIDGKFVGLVIDQHNQAMETEQRIQAWTTQIVPLLSIKDVEQLTAE